MSSKASVEEKMKEAIGNVQKKNVPPPPKVDVAPVKLEVFEGLLLASILRDKGFEEMARGIEDGGLVNPPVKTHALSELKAGAYVPDISKLMNYKPDLRTLASFALEMYLNGRVLLVGHTGTGKTEMVNFWSALTGQPIVRINYNQGVEVSDIIGSDQLRGDHTEYVEGVLPIAIREGYIILQDEVWRAPPGVMMVEQPLLEEGGYLRLLGKHEDDIVKPHEDTRFVFTDNTTGDGDSSGSYGTAQVQDASFVNRMTATYTFDYLPKRVEIGILKDMFPTVTADEVEALVTLAGLTRVAFTKGELATVMSMRQCKTILRRSPYTGLKEGVRAGYYNSLNEEQKGVFEELYNGCMGEAW